MEKFELVPKIPESSGEKRVLTPEQKEQFINEIFSSRSQIRSYVQTHLEKSYPTVVDEVTDEILQKAVLKLDKFAGKSSLKSWLETIKRREVVDFIREKKNKLLFQAVRSEKNSDVKNNLIEELNSKLNVEQNLLTEERNKILTKVIDKLKPELKQVILLYYFEDLNEEQIMPLVNLSKDGVGSRLHRARRKLAELLKEEKIESMKI
jgi:RNA polymerase sigma-70 factor (ECF subfamily)